jgi:SAM-dependent methyltransferase
MNCRSCGSESLHSIIPLGNLPLANGLLNKKQDHELYHNLEVMLCSDCGLAQLKDLIDPKDLFSEYVYFSSNSEGMLKSVAELVDRIQATLSDNALVVEIASNDGYLLKNYKNIEVLGIDPAANIAKVANEAGISTLCEFFSEELAANLLAQGKQADIIHANNVMAHVPDINGFIKGIQLLLKKTGQAIIEVPHFLDLFKKLEFDTIYHEHVYYFGLKPLITLFKRHGLEIFNLEKMSIHGGTLRLFMGHQGQHDVSSMIETILHEEEMARLYDLVSYQEFMAKIEGLKQELVSFLHSLKSQGKRIAAYGASAKGTTLLNYFGIGGDLLDFVVDKSPVKQGLYTPGTHLKIEDPKALLEQNSEYALLLAWNFSDEIVGQQLEYISKGGKIILPLPTVKVVP